MFYKGYHEDFWPKIFFIFFIFVRINSHEVVVFCGWSLKFLAVDYGQYLFSIDNSFLFTYRSGDSTEKGIVLIQWQPSIVVQYPTIPSTNIHVDGLKIIKTSSDCHTMSTAPEGQLFSLFQFLL